MQGPAKQLLVWAPRILSILFAIFVSVFALDVFTEGLGFWKTAAALLIHLIPTAVILVALAIAWRWEWAGGTLFVALGAWYIVEAWGRFPWRVYLVMTGPLFLIGTLFWITWLNRGRRPEGL